MLHMLGRDEQQNSHKADNYRFYLFQSQNCVFQLLLFIGCLKCKNVSIQISNLREGNQSNKIIFNTYNKNTNTEEKNYKGLRSY